ncbi:DNA polymerase III subunit gamma/tau [Porphyromonadaceae sp. NP-X]|jgi:DNA polymerase-3 subunit gamma/tau|nr:DNA polymerase III subunit gamma/tau [Paludibacteraceae bacterium]MDS1032681.1 DNA polymerase III subunit gamma/tau [Porphyromonadaceae sp. NP-X]
MKNYVVSARKYRPTTFKSVVGQTALTNTLKNAIKSNHLAHAYLFCGTRGVGKTTCARIFAKTINCEHLTEDFEACNECESCKAFNEQRSYNIHELDAASNNSVEGIRSLIDQVRIPPQIGKYSVYIIDEVHMLSSSAFNAFLKTLEEPPAHAIFILATTEKHKIIPTILSRCQIYDFNRISVSDIVGHLQYVAHEEGITVDVNGLNVIAQKCDGGMRDALSIFDQLVSLCGNNITYQDVLTNLNVLDYDYYFQLVDAFMKGDVNASLLIFNEIINHGFDAHHFVSGLSSHFRDLLVSKDSQTIQLLEVGADIGKHYQVQARQCPDDFIFQALKICNDCDLNYNISKNKRLLVEIMLIRLCQLIKPEKKLITEEKSEPLQKIVGGPVTNVAASIKSSPSATKIQNSTVGTPNGAEALKQIKAERPTSISIKNNVVSSPSSSYEKSQNEQPIIQNEKYSQEDLQNAWVQLAKMMTDEVRMTAFMQSNLPELISNTEFRILVTNELQEKELKRLEPTILNYLQTTLKNSNIKMSIQFHEDTSALKGKTPEEKYKIMAEENPTLAKLRNDLQLEID